MLTRQVTERRRTGIDSGLPTTEVSRTETTHVTPLGSVSTTTVTAGALSIIRASRGSRDCGSDTTVVGLNRGRTGAGSEGTLTRGQLGLESTPINYGGSSVVVSYNDGDAPFRNGRHKIVR